MEVEPTTTDEAANRRVSKDGGGASEAAHKKSDAWVEGKALLPGDKTLISDLTAPHMEDGAPVIQVRLLELLFFSSRWEVSGGTSCK